MLTMLAYRMGLEPASVCVSVRVCTQNFHIKLYLKDHWDWGKAALCFWARSNQNSGFNRNR